MSFFRPNNRLILAAILTVILPFSRAVASQRESTENVPIFIYHHVAQLPATANSALRRWTVIPEKFEEQIKWFAQNGYHTITMAQLTAHLKKGQPLPPDTIILSFDDGWVDHYTTVLPVLKKYNFTGTFFVTTDSVGHSAFVSWAQLEEMSKAGMDIQAHSLTHPHLDKLSSEEAFEEIMGSKKAIEDHLSKPAVVFAYPFGSYNDAVIRMVKRAGFESAASVSGMNQGYMEGHLYTLSRYAVTGDDTIDDLAQRLF